MTVEQLFGGDEGVNPVDIRGKPNPGEELAGGKSPEEHAGQALWGARWSMSEAKRAQRCCGSEGDKDNRKLEGRVTGHYKDIGFY